MRTLWAQLIINFICFISYLALSNSFRFKRKFEKANHSNSIDHTKITCPSSLIDGYITPPSKNFIYPRSKVVPFYQWEGNNGYCGETSIIQAGMAIGGIWMSQFNARLLCGAQLNTIPHILPESLDQILPQDPPRPYPNPNVFHIGQPLSQSGPDGWCHIFNHEANYNSQVLYETPVPGILSGTNDYAFAARCIENSGMRGRAYDSSKQTPGIEGYKQYMSWVKAQLIAGNVVSMGILCKGGDDPIYDHEVTVLKIGTNHDPLDSTYYPDDVLYFDDHGGLAVLLDDFSKGDREFYPFQPSVPPGASESDRAHVCTPYIFGYEFQAMVGTREDANKPDRINYSIILPQGPARVSQGADGFKSTVPTRGHNTGFFISGPNLDQGNILFLPVELSILSSHTNGVKNPMDPYAGYNYENPMIGNGSTGYMQGNACSNVQPSAMEIELEVLIKELTPGLEHYLFEYRFSSIAGVGDAAKLKIPVSGSACTSEFMCTPFVATDSTFRFVFRRSSMEVIVYRVIQGKGLLSSTKSLISNSSIIMSVSLIIVIIFILFGMNRVLKTRLSYFSFRYQEIPELPDTPAPDETGRMFQTKRLQSNNSLEFD